VGLWEILKARTLYLLGDKDKAKAIFARYGDLIHHKGYDLWIETLIESEVRVGLMDQAAEHAAKALGSAGFDAQREHLLPKLFPKNGKTAEVLWQILHGLVGDSGVKVRMEASEAMKRLRDYMAGKATARQLADLVAQGEKDLPLLTPKMRVQWPLALAETALIAKDEPLARSLLEKAGSAEALIRLGDLDAEQKQWDKAADHYSQAWKKEPKNPLAYYLNGWALKQAGQEKEGKKRMEQAHWMPLGDGAARFAFLRSLLERGQHEAAAHEGELMLRLGTPGSQYASEGMRQVALAAEKRKDYFAAAQGQERAMLVCLKSGISYSRPAAYLGEPALIHRLRAEGYTAAGDIDNARREIDLCWTALPGDALVPIELVPMWDKAGHKKEATELFEKYLAVQEKLCETYPNSTVGHNGAAWLSACCRRNLESAEQHALKAVELAPGNAGILDTLAEVEFQLGHKDKAIAAQKKAVALEPNRAYFRKQLKRIEAGNPSADRPSEDDDE
jgi:tetratricopeptide (TPR) repeat protein